VNTFMVLIDKWLSSSRIDAMEPAEENGYFRLLLHAAKSETCSLPNDDYELARLSRLNRAWFEKPKLSNLTRGERIRDCFLINEHGRLFNKQLTDDKERFEKVSEARKSAGHQGGRGNKGGKKKEGSGGQATTPESKSEANPDANGKQPESNSFANALAIAPPQPQPQLPDTHVSGGETRDDDGEPGETPPYAPKLLEFVTDYTAQTGKPMKKKQSSMLPGVWDGLPFSDQLQARRSIPLMVASGKYTGPNYYPSIVDYLKDRMFTDYVGQAVITAATETPKGGLTMAEQERINREYSERQERAYAELPPRKGPNANMLMPSGAAGGLH
jgi:uncharacterized protein YdaU (DUF1376 family)